MHKWYIENNFKPPDNSFTEKAEGLQEKHNDKTINKLNDKTVNN